jgi:two-component system, cell cycle response regulator
MNALILVADADPFNLRVLSELCSTLGYDVVTAADGGAVLDAVARDRPDLVLMDAALPVMDGLQVLRILKSDQDLAQLPVILVTADDDEESRRRGYEMGAEDYVAKPYRSFEIQQRLRNVLRLRVVTASMPPQPGDRLEIADPLTGTGTSSQLHISLEYEFTRAVRYRHPLSCVVVRCINYAQISTGLGSGPAQRVLVQLAGALRSCIRGVDHLFRSGTDEFTILLPETDAHGCRIVVDRLDATIVRGELFAAYERLRPLVVVASASYPTRKVDDGEALWRCATPGEHAERERSSRQLAETEG